MEQSNLLKKAIQLQTENKRVLITFKDGKRVTGKINFAGWNKFLNFEQLTIDTESFRVHEMKEIEEHILPKPIF